MNEQLRVSVIGASGFVGSAVIGALANRGYEAKQIHAPRLPRMLPDAVPAYLESNPAFVEHLVQQLQDCDAVVNAAGMATATATDLEELTAANAALAGGVGAACRRAGVGRLIHVSSAAVQGRRQVLDESDEVEPFSNYSLSKAIGERLVREHAGAIAVIYRPPSVQGVTRSQTRSIAWIASSPLASVARPGTSPSAQALIQNVGDAAAFLATTGEQPPSVVIHPWEGLTTSDVIELLGGRRPIVVPDRPARSFVRFLALSGRRLPALAANGRRLEMLWFGQRQADSWLTRAGWAAPAGRAAWVQLGHEIRGKQED